MKKLILTFIAFCFSVLAFGQTPKSLIIKGMVIDSLTKQSVDYVTVALQDVKTKLPIKSVLTKENGSFELNAAAGKPYNLVLAFVGYNTKTIAIADNNSDTDVGKIPLSPSNKKLDAVDITAVRPLMKREVDRISYDVQADPESKAISALDMMRKVPLLSVDASDNIKLKGSGNYKILINGRESAMMVKNPSDILKAMPATNVEKIEVITTPPAKYDAEGLAGIINIITKKNADQGYNVGINGRMNSVWGPGINMNGTFKQGKFGLSAYGGYGNGGNTKRKAEAGNTQNFFAQQSTLIQDGYFAFGADYTYSNAELSYEIDSLNLITGSIETSRNKYNQIGTQRSSFINSKGGIDQNYSFTNIGTGNNFGIDAAVNYQLGFKKQKDRLLTLSYKYGYSPNKQFNDNTFSQRINYPTSTNPDYQQYNSAGNKEHTFQLDYAHPLKKITIETGAKAIVRDNYSDYHQNEKDYTTNTYVTNASQTNNFKYQQNVYSLYNSYQVKFDKLTVKGGLRLEHTSIRADFSSVGSAVSQDYNNFIPSISIQRSFKSSSINFGFTERIQRPGIFQLNPFIDQTNPKFISTGNANLHPETNHAFELNYSNFAKSAINVGISYAFSNNSIQNVTGLQINHVGSQVDTVTITTFQNLGSHSTLGLNFNTNLNITKQLSFNINAQLNHIWLKGEYSGRLYKNDGYMGTLFANAGYKFGKDFRFGIDAGYYSGNVVLQGSSNKYIYSSYVLSKSFLKKTATISLVANNPYSKFQKFTTTSTTADFYQYGFSQNYYRTLAVRFNYKFGKLNSNIKKNQHSINNDDTKGGTKAPATNQ